MKKPAVVLVLLLSLTTIQAQKYVSRNAHIWFYSHTPIEDIEAHNKQAVSILDVPSASLQFSLLIKSFSFEKKLMEEHFNENYMESDKYPKASFKGEITNINDIDFSKPGEYKAEVTGDLTIRDVTKEITTIGKISVKADKVEANAKFVVAPKDYNIEIPSVVEDKIAREIEVNVEVSYPAN